jgi:hypothetical protein
MRVDVTQGIKEYDGSFVMTVKMDGNQPVLDTDKRPIQEIVPIRTYFINALNSQITGETLVAEDKAQIYYLSVKLFRNKEVELTKSDQKFILDRIGKIYPPIIYGRIMDLFEEKSVKADVDSKTTP